MADKKHILRRTAAFLTALVFTVRIASVGVVIAEEVTSAEMPVTVTIRRQNQKHLYSRQKQIKYQK